MARSSPPATRTAQPVATTDLLPFVIQAPALDSTFGSDTGKVLTAIGSGDAIGSDVAIDANGGIIVGGYSTAGSYRQLTLNRYDSFGNQDNSFGPVATSVGSANAAVLGLAIQGDGKIVVAGYGNSPVTFVVARYQ